MGHTASGDGMKRIYFNDKVCIQCEKKFNRYIFESGRLESVEDFKARIFCSRFCYFSHNTSKNHWFWKGGIKRRKDGYVRESKTDKYVHRIVMEKFLRRNLGTSEIIHHVDGNPSNNELSNLVVMTNSAHRKEHCVSQNRDREGRWRP